MGRSLRVQKFIPGSEESNLNLTLTRAFGEGYTNPQRVPRRAGGCRVHDAPSHVAQILLQKRHWLDRFLKSRQSELGPPY